MSKNDATATTENYSSKRLSPEIMAKLQHLGCQIDSPDEVPEPRFVDFDGEQMAVPEAFRQLIEDVTWPDEELKGETKEGWNYWMLDFFDDLRAFKPVELSYDYRGASSDRFLHIGWMDGGNYFLLLDLDEPNPVAPRWYSIDHDPYQVRPSTNNTWLQVLTCLGDDDGDEHKPVMEYVAMLSSEDDDTRKEAIKALGDIGPEAAGAVEALIKVIDDDRSYFKGIAISALGRIGVASDGLVAALDDALADPVPEIQSYAVEALSRLKGADEVVIPILAAVAADVNRVDHVRKSAARLLANYGPMASSETSVLLEALRERTALRDAPFGSDDTPAEVIKTISRLSIRRSPNCPRSSSR